MARKWVIMDWSKDNSYLAGRYIDTPPDPITALNVGDYIRWARGFGDQNVVLRILGVDRAWGVNHGGYGDASISVQQIEPRVEPVEHNFVSSAFRKLLEWDDA